ncbi:MAG: redoxin family protein, partial [Lentisphaerota bacterium]
MKRGIENRGEDMDRNQTILIGIVIILLAGIFLLLFNPGRLLGERAGLIRSVGPANLSVSQKEGQFPRAPDWSSYVGVINGPDGDNLSLADLKGKVVLVDFWTYSCINCIRTLPYVESWYEKYKNDGFVVVGMHSPEFDFEKVRSNVERAVRANNLTYPTVLDPDHRLWDEFGNSYWPRHYLIDKDGFIRYDHVGEGGYEETENAIVSLLSEGKPMDVPNVSVNAEPVDFLRVGTPELYFGGNFRRDPLGNSGVPVPEEGFGTMRFTLPSTLTPNLIYLTGDWKDNGDEMELVSNTGQIVLPFSAMAVHLVADAVNGSTVKVDVDGQTHFGPEADANGDVSVNGSRLYRLVKMDDYGTH